MGSGASVVTWALQSAGLAPAVAPVIEAALADAGVQAGTPETTWGLEVHHDGSQRVDLAVGRDAPAGRSIALGDVVVTTGDFDVWEYDIATHVHAAGALPDAAPNAAAGWELAGVFHGVQSAVMPSALQPLGAPVLASLMKGRNGQVRLLLPVPSKEELAAICDRLAEASIDAASLENLRAMAPLVTGPGVVRLGVEYLADLGQLGSRLGVEVLTNPAVFDVAPVLAGIGVSDEALARLRETAVALPQARERPRAIPWLPNLTLPPMIDAVGFTHFSVAWAPGVTPRVKSYLMVTSRVGADAQRDAVLGPRVQREGESWPARLAWAGCQLPLAPGFRRDAGSATGPGEVSVPPEAWSQWQQALGAPSASSVGEHAEHDGSHDRNAGRDGDLLTQRLRGAGITTAQAQVALSDAARVAKPTPQWLEWFAQLRDACVGGVATGPLNDDAALEWLAAREADMPEVAGDIPFAALWWPGVRAATDHMLGRVTAPQANTPSRIGPGAVRGIQLALLARLSMVSAPTLQRVMTDGLTYGQRLLRQMVSGQAQPPRAAFARFCAGLAAGGLDGVLTDFPVLPSLIGTAVRQWHEATLEMLTRVQRHRDDLSAWFGIDTAPELTGVTMSAGDQHNDGRSVAVLQFGAGRVVYKPRDMQLEQLWAEVLDVAGEQGSPLRAARVLAADDGTPYGFAEFIEHEPAADASELREFYRNAGRTLAVLHALSATDCHHENLIAHREQLVLIDAEALFETRNTRMHAMEPSESRSLGTVMDIGLLPVWMWLEGEQQAIDISALGASPESMRGRASRAWQAVNTDAMHRGPIEVIPEPPTSLPTPPGITPDLGEHAGDIVAGFEQGYRSILAARDRLSSQLLDAQGLHRRLIQRATYIYAALQFQSVEPDALRDRNARGMVLERLARAYLGGPQQAWALLAAEQEALARLDVPIFETDLRGTYTRWLDGELSGWPGDDALAGVLARLETLNEDDLRWQAKLIRSAIAARYFTPGGGESFDTPTSGSAPRPDAAATLAARIGTQVAGNALRAEGAATWMTLALLSDGAHANVQRIGTGLYDGILGVAGYLYERGDVPLAEAALTPLLDELESGDAARVRRQLLATGVGWSGAGGYLRALRWLQRRGHLAAQRADAAAAAVLESLSPGMITQDKWLDVMNGAAGLIGPLSAELADDRDTEASHRGRNGGRDHLEALLADAADHLLTHQQDDGGWITLPGRAALTGYAHGASGIALSLVVAHQVLGEQRYLDAALRGLAYEASTFDAAAGNWPDFRDTARGGFMLGWCAGAPGIALTRMRLLQLLPDHPAAAQWEQELELGASTTAEVGLLERDHVCCGNFGRVAVLETLGFEFGRDDWLAAAKRLREEVVARSGDGLPRPFLGMPGADGLLASRQSDVLAVPGLMTGLAGQGLVLNEDDPAATHQWASALLL